MHFSIKSSILIFLIVVYAGCGTALHQKGETALFATGATPTLISRQFSFTEGPATDKMGDVFFTDQPNNKIWKYSTDGKLNVFLEQAGRANGLYFDGTGNLIACADEHNQLWRVDAEGNVMVLLNKYNGKHLNGPNDVWVHPSGAIYFTDPYYQRPYWERQKPELEERNVYYLAKGETEPVAVIKGLQQPNGIIGTPDGQVLYVSDIEGGKTFKYKIQQDGRLSQGELFVEKGSDGMTSDVRGNVYLTGDGVTVFTSKGQQIAHIPIPEKWTSNVTFGGKDFNQLFITASEAIYRMDMQVKGAR